ncbi:MULTISPECIES: 3-oxoacyl-ACP reductase FabG [Bacillus]|uniref:3-oxoacyl-ACP reductase FabG n=1 Tax=Bacillus TaxID=1386 RepID=UPI00031B4B0A|nr:MULTISPECIES: 3-oxoacyl-ACP reductase FabG [Bacillus]
MKLQDKVAIITGGANGIGWEAVKLFLSEGAKVAIADYNETSAEEKIQSLSNVTDRVSVFKVNVADQGSVQEMVQAVVEKFGKIDILINNAGITKDAMLTKMTIEDFQSVIDVNLTGVFNCTQAVVPYLVANGNGRIINTSSVSGVYGNAGQTNYSAAKSGLIGMTKTWAKELGRKGITVNAVAPGFIETSMVETVPDHIIAQLKMLIPLQRLGKPEDIANAYLYLASDEANYINGNVLHVDGGIMM